MLAVLIASYFENRKGLQLPLSDTDSDDVEIELSRQRGLEMQVYAISFMLRVLIAVSSFTAVNRPRNERDIEVCNTDGASFYMKDKIVVYQAEVEVEGEITPEVEESTRREIQRYALKYVVDYPMLISPETGGRAPVEILGVKNCGNRILIDYVFTSKDSIPMIDARRRARLERQKRREHIAQYIDEDYGE